MDELEARRVLVEQLAPYRARPYPELVRAVGETVALEVAAPSGAEYNVEVMVRWDSPHDRVNVRVLGSVDDGRPPAAFLPLSEDFIMAPDGTFVVEQPGVEGTPSVRNP